MQENILSKINNNTKTNNLCSNIGITSIKKNEENKKVNNIIITKTNSYINKIELKQFKSKKIYFSPKAKTHRKNKLFLNTQKSDKKTEMNVYDTKSNKNIKKSRNKIYLNKKNKSNVEKDGVKINLKKNDNEYNFRNSCKLIEKSKINKFLKEDSIKELEIEENDEITTINNNILNNNNFKTCSMNNNLFENKNQNNDIINENNKITSSIFLNNNRNKKFAENKISNNNKQTEKLNFEKTELDLDLLKYSKKGDKEKVIELVKNPKLNINYKDDKGWTALHYACDEGNLKIAEILIKSNININTPDNEKKTPLHISAFHGFFDISKLLVKNGADLNMLDNENNLVIHLCAKNSHSELLAYFLDKNVENIFKKNKYGKTAKDLAKNIDTKLIIDECLSSLKDVININKKNNQNKENKNKYLNSKIIIHKTNQDQIDSLITPIHNFKDYLIKRKKINFYDYIHKTSTYKAKENKNVIFNYKNINGKINNDYLNKYNNFNINKSTSLFNNKKNSTSCFNISTSSHKSCNTNNNISNNINNNIIKNITNTSFKKKKFNLKKNKIFDVKKLHFNKNDKISSHIRTKTINVNESNKNIKYNSPLGLGKINEFITHKTTKIERYIKNYHAKNMKNNDVNLEKSKNKNNNKSQGKKGFSNVNRNDNQRRISLQKKIKMILEERKNSLKKNTKRAISSQGFLSTKNLYNLSKIKDRFRNNIKRNITSLKININDDKNNRRFNKKKEKNKYQNNTFQNNNIINISNESYNNCKKKLDKIYTDEEINLIEDLEEEETIIVNLKDCKEKNKLKIKKYNNKYNNEKEDLFKENQKKDVSFEKEKNPIKKNIKKNKRFRNNKINEDINLLSKKNKQNGNYFSINNVNINNSNTNITNPNSNSLNTNTKDSNINNPTTNTNTYNNEEETNKGYKTNDGDIVKKICPEDFICIGLLGQGSFGEVYLVNKKNTEKYYAMKVLDKKKIAQQNIFKYAITERNVLSIINFPFIVKLHYAFQTDQKLFLLLDYAPGGDLAAQLRLRKRFAEEVSKFYICEIALALGELHKHDIIFRDLKPDNIVIDKEGHILLTDFGLSRSGVSDRKDANSFCGSIAYLAPEMLNRKGHGKAVDWYLLGVVFFEMLVGIPPFFSNNQEQIFNNINKAELILPNYISKNAKVLIKSLLIKNPDERLGSKYDIEEIKNHEYFKDVNWDKVFKKEYIPPPIVRDINKIKFLGYPNYYMDYNITNDEDYFNHESSNYYYKNENENIYINNNVYKGWSFTQNDN